MRRGCRRVEADPPEGVSNLRQGWLQNQFHLLHPPGSGPTPELSSSSPSDASASAISSMVAGLRKPLVP